MSRYVERMGWRYKKAFRAVVPDHQRADVEEFCRSYQAAGPDILCIDEAGFYIGEIPRRGYARSGRRLLVATSRTLQRSKLTIVMAVSRDGVVACDVLDHNCRKGDFVSFIERLPVRPGSTLLMDNIAFHKSKETRRALENKGLRVLHTPPYSPRFNAIEYVFGSMKTMYRANCPLKDDKEDFDYASLVEACVACHTKLGPFFDHVADSVSDVLSSVDKEASGYDT